MTDLNKMKEWITQKKPIWLEQFYTFLRFQSISSEPEHKKSLLECADWVIQFLKEIGFETEIWPTKGHPVIFATDLKAGPDKPTLLIYNHYDVQPVDPLEEWISPPFEPTVREGEIYARGAQDNKGQCFYVLQALKMLKELTGSLPLNIKMCIEGEEEVGSSGLASILQDKKDKLKADYLAIVDVGIQKPTVPSLTLGIRGIVTMDVEMQGSKTDLHSGMVGGIVPNPIHTLVNLLASLRDATGRIAIPEFYRDVKELTQEERSQVSLDFDEKEFSQQMGTTPTGGETKFSPLERAWTRPTLEINGINGGYSGTGFKTVIPAKAFAKISCRLVPGQDPATIGPLVKNYLESHAPPGTTVKVHLHPGNGKAVRISPDSKVVKGFAQAYEQVFGSPCQFIFDGGSIPIVPELAKASGGEVILLGLGLSSDHIHAPNEHFGIDRVEKGMAIMGIALQLLGN